MKKLLCLIAIIAMYLNVNAQIETPAPSPFSKIEQKNGHSASKSKIFQRLRRKASSMRDEQEKASNCQMIVPVTLDPAL